ncbi:MAG: hypothetical protein ACK56F_14995, partial [bacterium]
ARALDLLEHQPAVAALDDRLDVERVDHARDGDAAAEQLDVHALAVTHSEHGVVEARAHDLALARTRIRRIPLRLEEPKPAVLHGVVHAHVHGVAPRAAIIAEAQAAPVVADRTLRAGEAADVRAEHELLERHVGLERK